MINNNGDYLVLDFFFTISLFFTIYNHIYYWVLVNTFYVVYIISFYFCFLIENDLNFSIY